MTTAVAEAQVARLPDAYAAFAPVFERMSEPFMQVLRGLLEQLELFAGAFDPPRLAPQGDFEGLGGLTLRGDIGHIVQSELLLRTEAPLEFLRRLAESETLYHEKLYADPGKRPIYRLMISTGPGSLGHGRIVAVAAVFFMARVAAAAGADFHWGFLPRAEGAVWFDGLSVNGVKRLLRSGAHREANAEDIAEADALWTQLTPDAPTRHEVDYLDWVVGALPRGASVGAALEAVPNSLGFSLLAPERGQPRVAELRLRHLGRERRRALITFPHDLACLGALKSPFRPPPARVAPAAETTGQRPSKAGWAPQYLVNPNGDAKMVRMADGLLVLWIGPDQTVSKSQFIPLAKDVQLAGVRLYRDGLTLLVHFTRGGSEFLALGMYQFPPVGPPLQTFHRIARASTEHLFRKQSTYALPSLTHIGGVRFHSTSGQPFEIAFGGGADDATFRPLYKEPRILASNGINDVVRVEGTAGPRLRVLKSSGHTAREFAEGDFPPVPPRLLGMVYSHVSSSLAYSVSPNRWMIARPATSLSVDVSQHRELTLKPWETLLSGTVRTTDLSTRIWSDARYGGEGDIRNVRFIGAQTIVKTPVIKLGDDAMNVVAIDIGADGLAWSVTADDRGEPNALISYASRKSGSAKPARYDLAEHRAAATVLDMDKLLG